MNTFEGNSEHINLYIKFKEEILSIIRSKKGYENFDTVGNILIRKSKLNPTDKYVLEFTKDLDSEIKSIIEDKFKSTFSTY